MTMLVCPHCGIAARFTHHDGYELPDEDFNPSGDWARFLSCDHCSMPVLGIGPQHENEYLRLWPESVPPKFPDVPDHIATVAIEAHQCSTIGAPRAAVTMARATVEAVAKDKGITTGNLAAKIDALHAAGHISEAMKEAAHEIRFAGNEAAHADIVHENISVADADEIVTLLNAILERVYQEPARVERVRQRRQQRTAGPGSSPSGLRQSQDA